MSEFQIGLIVGIPLINKAIPAAKYSVFIDPKLDYLTMSPLRNQVTVGVGFAVTSQRTV